MSSNLAPSERRRVGVTITGKQQPSRAPEQGHTLATPLFPFQQTAAEEPNSNSSEHASRPSARLVTKCPCRSEHVYSWNNGVKPTHTDMTKQFL